MRESRHEAIAAELRGRIGKGEFPGNRLPPERELAAGYGGNRITLRKALRTLYEERLIARLGARGTYVVGPEALARAARPGRRIAYLLFERDFSNAYHGAIMTAVQRALEASRSALSPHALEPDGRELSRLLEENARSRLFDAVVADGVVPPATARALLGFGVPLALVGNLANADPLEASLGQVLVDHAALARRGTAHLLSLGARAVAFVDGPAFQWSMLAQQGYMGALEDAGLPYREELVFHCPDSAARSGFALAPRLAGSGADAAFVRSDTVARGLFDGLEPSLDRGRVVCLGHPGDSVEHLGAPRLVVDTALLAAAVLEVISAELSSPLAPAPKRLVPVGATWERGVRAAMPT